MSAAREDDGGSDVTITIVLGSVLVSFAGGYLTRHYSRRKRPRCTAFDDWGYNEKDGFYPVSMRRCPERVDLRCDNDYCIQHCRSEDRCNGTHVDPVKAKVLKLVP